MPEDPVSARRARSPGSTANGVANSFGRGFNTWMIDRPDSNITLDEDNDCMVTEVGISPYKLAEIHRF
ncbi:hypothetical protein JCM24511_05309 [Saitozyma sp. JCM 24511]|nr:hypothetical protein JCM24511_05309 [Saitozyma sp. JCM 24511]